jgi:hypothetical protein
VVEACSRKNERQFLDDGYVRPKHAARKGSNWRLSFHLRQKYICIDGAIMQQDVGMQYYKKNVFFALLDRNTKNGCLFPNESNSLSLASATLTPCYAGLEQSKGQWVGY